MTINLKFKSLIVTALLSGMSSFAAESAEEDKSLAPEVAAVDANISFRDILYLKEGDLYT